MEYVKEVNYMVADNLISLLIDETENGLMKWKYAKDSFVVSKGRYQYRLYDTGELKSLCQFTLGETSIVNKNSAPLLNNSIEELRECIKKQISE